MMQISRATLAPYPSSSGRLQLQPDLHLNVRLKSETTREESRLRLGRRNGDALISINGQVNTLMLAAQIKSRFRLTVKATPMALKADKSAD